MFSAEVLAKHEESLRKLKIEDMEASRPEDKKEILDRIPDVARFNTKMQELLFGELFPAWSNWDAERQAAHVSRMLRWQLVSDSRFSVGIFSNTETISPSESG